MGCCFGVKEHHCLDVKVHYLLQNCSAAGEGAFQAARA